MRPWPKLESRSYAGTVINGATKEPVDAAVVVAFRPSVRGIAFAVADEGLGDTITDEHGEFLLTTREGYATYLEATTPDGRLIGYCWNPGKKSADQLAISMSPHLSGIIYDPSVDPDSFPEEAVNAIVKLVDHIASNPDDRLLSLSAYHADGILSRRQFDTLRANLSLLSEPDPSVIFRWGDSIFVFHGSEMPVEIRFADSHARP